MHLRGLELRCKNAALWLPLIPIEVSATPINGRKHERPNTFLDILAAAAYDFLTRMRSPLVSGSHAEMHPHFLILALNSHLDSYHSASSFLSSGRTLVSYPARLDRRICQFFHVAH